MLASKLPMGGLFCSWQTFGATPGMPNLRGRPKVLARRYLYLSLRDPPYLLMIWMWRCAEGIGRRWV